MAKLIGPLQPYKPSSDTPFNAVRAAHLLNRAGFGGTEGEIKRVLELAARPEGVVYAVPGHPLVAEETVRRIRGRVLRLPGQRWRLVSVATTDTNTRSTYHAHYRSCL